MDFVELPNTVEGLVHINSLIGDYYAYVPDLMAIIGQNTKKLIVLVLKLQSKLSEQQEAQTIDFEIYGGAKMEINNRKAYFDYFVEKEEEAGISLTGTEIKSVRKGSVDLKDSYVRIRNGEAFVINLYIAKYEEGNRFNHDERRTRKLLLHKKK